MTAIAYKTGLRATKMYVVQRHFPANPFDDDWMDSTVLMAVSETEAFIEFKRYVDGTRETFRVWQWRLVERTATERLVATAEDGLV